MSKTKSVPVVKFINQLDDLDTEIFVKHDRKKKKGGCLDSRGQRTSTVEQGKEAPYSPCDSGDSISNEFSVIYRLKKLPIDKVKGVKIILAGEALIQETGNPDLMPIPHHISFYKKADDDYEIEIHYMTEKVAKNDEGILTDLHPAIQHP